MMKISKKKYNYENFKNLSAKDLFGGINLLWVNDNRLYEIIKKDVYDMIKKGNRSEELRYIANFLDEIDNEYIKNKEEAREGLNIVKQNVKIEASQNIVKEDDRDDKGDGDDKDDGESIGERK